MSEIWTPAKRAICALNRGTPDSIWAATLGVMKNCCAYPNFVISSGCDIPPRASWENIDAFFAAVEEYYGA